MLNIFKQKHKDFDKKHHKSNLIPIKLTEWYNSAINIKHFPPSTQEWYNSIYVYDKNYTKLLPSLDNTTIELINSYFNLQKKAKHENKMTPISLRLQLKLKRLSTNKVFVSKAELKHTPSKIVIVLYIYNEQERYLLDLLNSTNPALIMENKSFLKKFYFIKLQGLKIINQVRKEKDLLVGNLKILSDKHKSYEILVYKNFIKRSLKKEILNINYLHSLYLTRSKLKNNNLLSFNKILNTIYNKEVELNVVNLKYPHLNSNIFLQSIVAKLKNRKNSLLNVLKNSLSFITLPLLRKYSDKYDANKIRKNIMSAYFDKTLDVNKDSLQIVLQKLLNNSQIKDENDMQRMVLNSIRDKSINGVRLEASGRLTKRFTASRSVFKFKYMGSLKNIDSSYNCLSSVILRGHLKSNVQYTKISSKTRNGSFGLKGWISGN